MRGTVWEHIKYVPWVVKHLHTKIYIYVLSLAAFDKNFNWTKTKETKKKYFKFVILTPWKSGSDTTFLSL